MPVSSNTFGHVCHQIMVQGSVCVPPDMKRMNTDCGSGSVVAYEYGTCEVAVVCGRDVAHAHEDGNGFWGWHDLCMCAKFLGSLSRPHNIQLLQLPEANQPVRRRQCHIHRATL